MHIKMEPKHLELCEDVQGQISQPGLVEIQDGKCPGAPIENYKKSVVGCRVGIGMLKGDSKI